MKLRSKKLGSKNCISNDDKSRSVKVGNGNGTSQEAWTYEVKILHQIKFEINSCYSKHN